MLESILITLDELRRTFRIVDAIDILLVAAFLYTGLVWFQRTASRGLLAGVAVLAAIYFLARGLDMYLTSLAFHTTFAVLLFILVVVFQEDLRRMFERMSALPRNAVRQDSVIDVESLVDATFAMAASRIGALMVIRGKEPLERHLTGGVALEGRISKALLRSIFDSHSPGHDGAVIIDNNRITQFAAHLPISTRTREIAGRGTRHSAALGLSEKSDALTIVVSEERGVVSVAESGRLKEITSAPLLKRRLETFLTGMFPQATQPLWERILAQHGRLKIVAFAVAVIAWSVLAYDPNTIQRTFVVPLEYRNLPADLELDRSAPTEARLTLSGLERNFRFLDLNSLKITLDLAESAAGLREFPISDRNIRLPANLVPYRIEPRIVRLQLRHRQAPPAHEEPGLE